MTDIVETQAFTQFTLSRYLRSPENDYEILFFEEVIRDKLNRSKLRFTKVSTPFLMDKTLRVSKTVTASKPEDILDVQINPSLDQNWPISFNLDNFGSPRSIQSLTTESDESMLRSHTNQILQRSRMNQVSFISPLTGIIKLAETETRPFTMAQEEVGTHVS